jgi:DNA-binding PadR family transcriptional regulator
MATSQTQAVLASLLARPEEPRYGLEIANEAGLASGTIYPVLARLERMGWVTSEWENVDESRAARPRRRYYRLTGEGKAAAHSELEAAARRVQRAGVGLTPRPEAKPA